MANRIPNWLPRRPNGDLICGKCHGDGSEEIIEDGRQVDAACYHCGNTGVITPEIALSDYMTDLATGLAAKEVSEDRRAIDKAAQEADGEGWDFMAAENGISGHEMYRERVWRRAEEIGTELVKLPSWVQWMLVDDAYQLMADIHALEVVNTLSHSKPKSVQPPAVTVPAGANDDIPF